MAYTSLKECVYDLEKIKQLIRIEKPVDTFLEIGAIQRRVYKAGGPALLFTKVKNCRFPMLGNLFGTMKRTRYLFRESISVVQDLIDLKLNPSDSVKKIIQNPKLTLAALKLKPKLVGRGPVLKNKTTLDQLPQLVSWPYDGGAFITLPQVYTEDAFNPGLMHSNLGMYRIQISGNNYASNEVGLHYQIHRGIGVHHAKAIEKNIPFKVNIFVGGPPAMTLASVMPLPEGLTELAFAGVLGGKRIEMIQKKSQLAIYAHADFCISGTVIPNTLKPEGPFGDHLGYYSLKHDFPVLKVENIYHRDDAIWPFTTVGRPPQEDTCFGQFIHELTGPLIPNVLPGVKEVHAVDAAGVHPLLLAIGSERYTPFKENHRPQEILTQANAILGQGQLSLAKYLFIINKNDAPQLSAHDVPNFLSHVLERISWERDIHFQTQTTMDTLDYSAGENINEGSKVIFAISGPQKRELPSEFSSHIKLPHSFEEPKVPLPGILVLQTRTYKPGNIDMRELTEFYSAQDEICSFPLIIVTDDSHFATQNLNNLIWVTFTKSNPASDIHGISSFVHNKHWGCHGSLIIDARQKPYQAPPLVDDAAIEKKVDQLGKSGGPLFGII